MFTLPPKVTRQQLEKQDKATLVQLVLNMQENWLAADSKVRDQDALLVRLEGVFNSMTEAGNHASLPPWLKEKAGNA